MVRIIVGAIVGFFAWSFVWVGSEKIMSAIWPHWYGAHQMAFEAAIKTGGQFTPDTTILLLNVVRGAIVSQHPAQRSTSASVLTARKTPSFRPPIMECR